MHEMCWNRRLFPDFFSTSCTHLIVFFAHWQFLLCDDTPKHCTLFVVCRIIKSDVTIIFILLLALGLIANYCYWVFGVRACVSVDLSDCEGCDTCSCRSCSLNFKNRNVIRLFFLSTAFTLCLFLSLATRFANWLAYLRYIEYLTNRFTFRWLVMVGGCFFFVAAILIASIRLSILRRFSRWVMWCVHRTCHLVFFPFFLSRTQLCSANSVHNNRWNETLTVRIQFHSMFSPRYFFFLLVLMWK